MCTVGGPMDVEMPEDRVKTKNYKCRECGEHFKGVGRETNVPFVPVRGRSRGLIFCYSR